MKILHTADIHLREYNDERWQALRRIVEESLQQQVDVLVISGDLFDSTADAQKLRSKIRELFNELSCPVILIGGNHDAQAYPEGTFWGPTVTVIRDLLTPVEIQGAYFWGFPYEDLLEEEILEYLHLAGSMAGPEATHILLFHGELLDFTEGWAGYGDEGQRRYLPVKLSYFRELPWQYVLAGHFHSNFEVHEFSPERYFVYPGSPIPITRREIGPRRVNLFRIGEPPTPMPLDTPFYERMELRLHPFLREDPLTLIHTRLGQLPEQGRLLVEVTGYYDGSALGMTEEELYRALSRLKSERLDFTRLEFRDVRDIVEDELFKMFVKRLQEKPWDEQ
ncbi:MAG: DNA repair exonuclease, partial [Calditrichaeota bacterium]